MLLTIVTSIKSNACLSQPVYSFFSSYLHYFINKTKSLLVTSEMVQLRGSNISLDHTFKASSNAGLVHFNKWSIKYDLLFFVLK